MQSRFDRDLELRLDRDTEREPRPRTVHRRPRRLWSSVYCTGCGTWAKPDGSCECGGGE